MRGSKQHQLSLINIRRLVAELEFGMESVAAENLPVEAAIMTMLSTSLRHHLAAEGFLEGERSPPPLPAARRRREAKVS